MALTLARTRLMSAKLPYYLLADTPEGRRKEAELAGLPPGSSAETRADVRKGFVYKRVPHVTLKSIANNPDIREGMSRPEIDAAIARHADSELLYDQPSTQAGHWFSQALMKAVMLLDTHPDHESLIVLPDYPRCRDLAQRTRRGRAAAGVHVVFVGADGTAHSDTWTP